MLVLAGVIPTVCVVLLLIVATASTRVLRQYERAEFAMQLRSLQTLTELGGALKRPAW